MIYTIIAKWNGAVWSTWFKTEAESPADIVAAAWKEFCAENDIEPEPTETLENNKQNFEAILIFRGELAPPCDQIYWGDTGVQGGKS